MTAFRQNEALALSNLFLQHRIEKGRQLASNELSLVLLSIYEKQPTLRHPDLSARHHLQQEMFHHACEYRHAARQNQLHLQYQAVDLQLRK